MLKKPDDLDPKSVRYKWRKRRFRHIEKILRGIIAERKHATIIDVGGTRKYWTLIDPDIAPHCSVTLVNYDFWLSPLKSGTCENGITFIDHVGDGCDLKEFSDGQFDLAHSNSVIEHVGSLERMAAFARELRRVGRAYFCQTPYLWFPIEPHHGVPFFHWLPAPTRARLTYQRPVGWRPQMQPFEKSLKNADESQLIDLFTMRALFPDAEIHKERAMGLIKSLMAVCPGPSAVAATTHP